jgi:hypothetical protein
MLQPHTHARRWASATLEPGPTGAMPGIVNQGAIPLPRCNRASHREFPHRNFFVRFLFRRVLYHG